MKPRGEKNRLRDLRDNQYGRRGYQRREDAGDADGSFRYWAVPSWYTRMLTRSERPAERAGLHDLKKDPEATPPPRRHKRDAGYYW